MDGLGLVLYILIAGPFMIMWAAGMFSVWRDHRVSARDRESN